MFSHKQRHFVVFITVMIFGLLLIQGSQVNANALNWLFPNEPKEEDVLTDEDKQIIEDTYNIIQTSYIKEVDKTKLLQGALKGMVNALEDPYSEFLTEKESEVYDETIEGTFHGVGIQFMLEGENVKVITAIDGTPDSEAGIQPNDIILKADDKTLKGMNTSEIVNLIRGPLDSEVVLTIQRADETIEVPLKRAEIPIETVTGEIDKNEKTIAHIKMTQFNSTTYDEMVDTIEEMRKKGAEKFVFDLRYNPGGLLDQALMISNMFLKDGDIIMSVEEGSGKTTKYTADDRKYGDFQVDEPFVLLINDGSASASEILAGTIKENTEAPIVGIKSFGKGTVQNFPASNYLGELKLSVAKWLLPSGLWINEAGIKPTVTAEPSKIEKILAFDPKETLEEGSLSSRVESLTVILETFGYLDKSGKNFDAKVTDAVKKYQTDKKLTVDGKVGQETMTQLMTDVRDYYKENDSQYDKAVETLLSLEEQKAA